MIDSNENYDNAIDGFYAILHSIKQSLLLKLENKKENKHLQALLKENNKLIILLDEYGNIVKNTQIDKETINDVRKSLYLIIDLQRHNLVHLKLLIDEYFDDEELNSVTVISLLTKYKALISDINKIIIPCSEYNHNSKYVALKLLIDNLFN